MKIINISDEDGRNRVSDITIFDEMSEDEAKSVFGDLAEKSESDFNLVIKGEKKIWIKPTSKRVGHYRRITGAKEVEEKPYSNFKPGDQQPKGLDKGAYVNMGEGKLKVDVIYPAPGLFGTIDGKMHNIKDIIKLYPKSEESIEEITARLKQRNIKVKKEKFEIDAKKYFDKCKETEQGSNNLRSLQEYSGKNYNEVNEYLIMDISDSDKDKLDSQIRNISSILNNAPKYEGEVYRGMRFKNKNEFNLFLSQCNKDKVLSMSNFISTSINKNIAKQFSLGMKYSALFTIKSKRGVFLGDISQNVNEKEILFNNNSEFKILNIKKIDSNKFDIIMEEI